MYNTDVLNNIIRSIESSSHLYTGYIDYITTIQSFRLIIEKFNLEEFIDTYNITEEEYAKFFEEIMKKHNKRLHKIVQDEFKNGRKSWT